MIAWIAETNYKLIELLNNYWWYYWMVVTFTGSLVGMSPLKTHHEQAFHEYIFVHLRKFILGTSVFIVSLPALAYFTYTATLRMPKLDAQAEFKAWFISLLSDWYLILPGVSIAFIFRFARNRYFSPIISKARKSFRYQQSHEKPSDIREEATKHEIKEFRPSLQYDRKGIFVGLDKSNKPIRIPTETWHETNMQVIGPTRYGKGILLGNIMDQAIKNGDGLFYIDPKKDKFAPHIMYQACKETGRKFVYLALHDDGPGEWAPFKGGKERDGLSRLERAFGLEFSGDPGTDYYKSQERKGLVKTFRETRDLEALLALLGENDDSRIAAELSRWQEIKSLRPKSKGFSIAEALQENAVVYVQGHLDDDVVKTATKVFIVELIQEARRLEEERKTHLTAIIDEVSFLVSKELAQALATAVGFRVNFALAYQSQNDLLNLDDKTVDGKYVHNSINTNCQLKAIYGGADEANAKWISGLSGTISKAITKLERTDISGLGGETWENQRAIGPQEENYINVNTILSLPPRVCVFIQPRHLAKLCYTSFVPVDDMQRLKKLADKKPQTKTTKEDSCEEGNYELKKLFPKISESTDQQTFLGAIKVSGNSTSKDLEKMQPKKDEESMALLDEI